MANPHPIPPGGRPKGVLNKLTVELKDMIRGALDDAGGRSYLHKQAQENPVAFMGLIAKIIPNELKANFSGSGKQIILIKFGDDPQILDQYYQLKNAKISGSAKEALDIDPTKTN